MNYVQVDRKALYFHGAVGGNAADHASDGSGGGAGAHRAGAPFGCSGI